MKSKTSQVKLSAQNGTDQLKLKEKFPKAICLESCQMKMTKGYEKDVLDTLKAFSDGTKFNEKTPHPLHKQGGEMENFYKTAKKSYGAEKVYSLDVKVLASGENNHK